MSEQKVWVEKMPESCSKCLFCYDNRPYWKSTDCIINYKELDEDEIETSVNENCPLQSIHDHDREKDKRIKELEDKIRELQEVDNKRAFRLYCMLYDMLEEKDPENVASRIDYLTGKDYSEMCELYKTAKNLKQHDRELVKEVLEKVSIELENETETYCEIRQCNSPHYQGDYIWFNYVKFRKLAEKLQKEFEDE